MPHSHSAAWLACACGGLPRPAPEEIAIPRHLRAAAHDDLRPVAVLDGAAQARLVLRDKLGLVGRASVIEEVLREVLRVAVAVVRALLLEARVVRAAGIAVLA